MERKLVIRVPDWLYARVLSMADKNEVSMSTAARELMLDTLEYGDRIDEYRARIKNLQEQNDSILGTYTSLLNQTEIAQTNFNSCVISLMAVLEGKVSEDEKRHLVTQFAPYAELARRQQDEAKRQYEERQKMVAEAKAAARKKKSVDE
jgi:multidrug efflux pump subunit AcrA (membrane-fusion protein)